MKYVAYLLSLPLFVCACGDNGGEDIAKKTGARVGEAVTAFASGVAEGVDKELLVEVELSEGMQQRGFAKTTAKSLGLDEGRGFTVYLTSKEAFTGKLIAKALNAEGLEVGRSVVEVQFTTDDGQSAKFVFDAIDSQLVEKFSLDIRTDASEADAAQ